MKKYIYILFLFIIASQAQAHTSHYKNISKIEMEVFRNDKLIGYSNYYFEHKNNTMIVTNDTKFEVQLFGVKIFKINGSSREIYKNGKLISYNSSTIQNDKKKFVNLTYDNIKNKFIINGSSYKGKAEPNNIIGNWWNSKILSSKSQISPLSGSIKKQSVKLVGKDEVTFNGKKLKLFKFKIKSINQNLPDDKKLNFDVWLDPREGFIVKVSYERLGKWEYILKKVE